MSEYVLGCSPREAERLRDQHEVWGPVTRAFLDRLGLRAGARVLDAGCGPGFVARELLERVGPTGEVVALDELRPWVDELASWARREGHANLRPLQGRLEEVELPAGAFDLIFLRWVLSFLPNPGTVVSKLAQALAPGGVLAIQDYNHEGISLFPRSEGFERLVVATRALHASGGGDPWIGAKAPRLLAEAGLALLDLHSTVQCGGPGSPIFRWADLFFVPHSETMVTDRLLTPEERRRFLEEWEARKSDAAAVFFSPIVVDAAGRRPADG